MYSNSINSHSPDKFDKTKDSLCLHKQYKKYSKQDVLIFNTPISTRESCRTSHVPSNTHTFTFGKTVFILSDQVILPFSCLSSHHISL